MMKMKKIAAMAAALLICSGTMGYMPQNTFINADIATVCAAEGSVAINETNFPDAIFRQYVAENFDIDGDGVLSEEEISAVTRINVSNKKISDLTGVEYFKNLTGLFCNENNLTALDVSNNKALATLWCHENNLTALDVSKNTNLGMLHCYRNKLTSLDLSNNTAIIELRCSENQLTTLDVSNITKLQYFYCHGNKLTSLDVSNNTKLEWFLCGENQLTSLDVSNNTNLTHFSSSNNQLPLDVSNNKFDLSTLPTGFDVKKASEWTNGTVSGNILTVEDASKEVTYKYDCGNEKTEIFTLITKKSSAETPSVTIYGDANCDGKLTIADSTAILQSLGNADKYGLSEQGVANADINGVAGISVDDAILIQKIDAKLITLEDLPVYK